MTRDGEVRPRDAEGPRADGREPRAVEARELLAGGREVIILHRGERYRLRVTQHDKLILTK
ncbi:hemin uptake protein HemP [Enterovirga sp. DB1703]|uniref:Hemin uptake protein HemP n=2 Tax=Enterovirga aerilata TaxID=2730920 RepID=A0A849I5A0_9HYPH|nr:hemin uptake protein HemP [Enterovirga sp. DB1703]